MIVYLAREDTIMSVILVPCVSYWSERVSVGRGFRGAEDVSF